MEIWILRIVHISTGIFWAGYAIFAGLLLAPAMNAVGPASGAVMGELNRRKLSVILAAISGLNVLSGLRLYAIDYSGDWFRTSTGLILSLGALVALGAFVYGMIVTKPAATKMGSLGAAIRAAGGQPTPEQAAEQASLNATMTKSLKLNAYLLIIAALCMAASRFAPQI